jgi:hypothetical protein
MLKPSKVFSLFLCTVILLCMYGTTAYAQSEEKLKTEHNKSECKLIPLEDAVPFEASEIVKIGQMSIKSAVVINGVTNYLYPTFDDIDKALENLKRAIPTYYSPTRKH